MCSHCDKVHTVMCSLTINYHQQRGNSYLRFPEKSEVFVSELPENLEEIFPTIPLVMYTAGSNIQLQYSVLPILKKG